MEPHLLDEEEERDQARTVAGEVADRDTTEARHAQASPPAVKRCYEVSAAGSAIAEAPGMSKRRRARAARRKTRTNTGMQQPQDHRQMLDAPPIGPGKAIDVEEIPIAAGAIGTIKRYRNHGEHPLTLLHYRHKFDGPGRDGEKLGRARFAAGESFRMAFEATLRPGQTKFEPTARSGQPTTLADVQLDAGLLLRRIKLALGDTSTYLILEAFCGKGFSAIDALRIADVPFAPQGVIPRVAEALDDLVRVLNRPLPHLPRRGAS